MTKPYSLAFKQNMLERLTGKDAVSARQLSVETGVRQQNLSRWLQEARSLPAAGADAKSRQWTVQRKARVLADASGLSGDELHAYLDREGVRLVDFERWRTALQEDGRDSAVVTRRIRQLERELARKEKALAEAAALLVLKKKIAQAALDEDDAGGPHRRPPNALRPSEEAQILTVMVSARFAHLSPKQLVPQLADEGPYLASESTLYRLQRRYGLRRRPRMISRTDVTRAVTLHRATGPNQVWRWDITWLPTTVPHQACGVDPISCRMATRITSASSTRSLRIDLLPQEEPMPPCRFVHVARFSCRRESRRGCRRFG